MPHLQTGSLKVHQAGVTKRVKRLDTKRKERVLTGPAPRLFPQQREGCAGLAAAAATLLPQLLPLLPALGDGDPAVAVSVETLEALQRPGAELRQRQGAAIGERATMLTAIGTTIGLALGAVLRTLLRAHRLYTGTTLGAALGALCEPFGALRHALLGAGTLLRRELRDPSLTARLALRLLVLAASPHLLSGEAAVAVGVETGKARFGPGKRLLARHFSAAAALGGLRLRSADGGEQGTGDKAELDGFHG